MQNPQKTPEGRDTQSPLLKLDCSCQNFGSGASSAGSFPSSTGIYSGYPHSPCRINHITALSASELKVWLESEGYGAAATVLGGHGVCGSQVYGLNDAQLERMGLSDSLVRMNFLSFISKQHPVCVNEDDCKVFNDPIHGHIEMHPLCVAIIDTPQFQRLRHLNQLGACYMVFPGASHKRFEHSLGVCHLAGLLARRLRDRQPVLGITDVDILCVEIAGLCHDLGHGPYSHMYDGVFVPLTNPESTWTHEQGSVDMLDHLIEDNNLMPVFEKYGLTKTDCDFIKEQISGNSWHVGTQWNFHGRDVDKSFLYEIVSNKRNGVDVDKWDYFARDCYNLGISNSFDHLRLMKFARVLGVEGQMQICWREKEVENLYNMFHVRINLHRRAYQHKTNKIIETMLCEAFKLADPHILFTAKHGTSYTMSNCMLDMSAYQQLTDNVYHRIRWSDDPKLKPAKDILIKIECRDLYKCIGGTKSTVKHKLLQSDCKKISEEILQLIPACENTLTVDDIIVHLVKVNYGMNTQNPIDHMRFYRKEKPLKAFRVRQENISDMLPQCFEEQLIRVYCKKKEPAIIECVSKYFKLWCEKTGMASLKESDEFDTIMTPIKGSPLNYDQHSTNGQGIHEQNGTNGHPGTNGHNGTNGSDNNEETPDRKRQNGDPLYPSKKLFLSPDLE